MGYYEFPRTSNYDTDMTELIELYKELLALYKGNETIINEINSKIVEIVEYYFNLLLESGDITVDSEYIDVEKKVKVIFEKNEVK